MCHVANDYFEAKFFNEFIPSMRAFESARLFNPGKVTDLKPTAASVDGLKAFPFFKGDVLNALKLELPSYLAAADGTPREVNALEWWNHNKSTLPQWSQAFNKVILVQPSSASAKGSSQYSSGNLLNTRTVHCKTMWRLGLC